MKKLRVGVLDLVAMGPMNPIYARVLLPTFGAVMTQVVATWCQGDGHEVSFLCYTGQTDLLRWAQRRFDFVFISGFTHTAYAAYAISAFCRAQGTVTALGGPHARAYPADAEKHFDYVLGLTDRETVREVLRERAPRRGPGRHLSARRQPQSLPGIRERWPFIEQAQRYAPVKGIPALGSLGCPYTCSFCVDADVPYQAIDLALIKEDLRFARSKIRHPRVVWHDPNFGVRFDEYLTAIEEAVPPGSIDFVAESSLSLLSEPRLRRLQRNGFKALLPGIESWFELGAKSRTGRLQGLDKVLAVAEHVRTILRYVPYVQANFIVGLDSDEGPEPFELTRRFIDLAPGAFVAVALLTVYGESAPIGESMRREGRLLRMPFHHMNSGYASNVIPRHYRPMPFYDEVVRLLAHNFSLGAIARRHAAVSVWLPRWVNVARSLSEEGRGRVAFLARTRRRLEEDAELRGFLEGDRRDPPPFFTADLERRLGPLFRWLPRGAVDYDPDATLGAAPRTFPLRVV